MANSTVTIDKGYFETLLRRAQFHTSGIDFTTPAHLPMVTIPKVDHDTLLKSSREYANLRRNLITGGVTYQTLAILTVDAPAGALDQNEVMTTGETVSETGDLMSQMPRAVSHSTFTFPAESETQWIGRNNGRNPSRRFNNTSTFTDQSAPPAYDDSTAEVQHDNSYNQNNNILGQRHASEFQRVAKRSVQLEGLPDNATHAEVADIVRGGLVLDIYLRDRDHSAVVSFLEEKDAFEFFRCARRNDLYIRGKRVDISWNDRQFILPNHVANKIAMGATRNLVIHDVKPTHTEEMIRNDLEHIHNLVVLSVMFKEGNAHVSTNSVHNALFARTCMMSRATYKGMKINWEADECANPIIPKNKPVYRKEKKEFKKKAQANRFELLNVDEGGEEDNDTTLPSISSNAAPVAA